MGKARVGKGKDARAACGEVEDGPGRQTSDQGGRTGSGLLLCLPHHGHPLHMAVPIVPPRHGSHCRLCHSLLPRHINTIPVITAVPVLWSPDASPVLEFWLGPLGAVTRRRM